MTSALRQSGSSRVPSIRGACPVRTAFAIRFPKLDGPTWAAITEAPMRMIAHNEIRVPGRPQVMLDRRALSGIVMGPAGARIRPSHPLRVVRFRDDLQLSELAL